MDCFSALAPAQTRLFLGAPCRLTVLSPASAALQPRIFPSEYCSALLCFWQRLDHYRYPCMPRADQEGSWSIDIVSFELKRQPEHDIGQRDLLTRCQ